MAKAKKETLSIDERLQQALVLESEQPYKLPENWVWTKIGICFGVTSSKRVFKEEWQSSGIPFYRTRELVILSEKGYVDNELFITQKLYNEYAEIYGVPKSGDLLISGVGTIGVPFLISSDKKFYFKDGNIIWFQNTAKIVGKYIFYLYKSVFMINQLMDFSSGTTVDTYTIVNAKQTIFPLPPRAEQQRIVAVIELLFEKLDKAKELAQSALDSFKMRKAAILHKAFTGELTAKWREKNRVKLEDWEEQSLKNVCLIITDGTHQTPTYSDEGYIFLSSKNVTSERIDWDHVKYIPESLHNQLYARLAPRVNDILLAKNGTTGIAAIVDRECVFDIYVSLALLRPNTDKITPLFLLHTVNNPITKEKFNNELTGIGLQNLHLRDIRSTTIPLPTIPEQQEIVRILDSLLENEQKAKDLCDVIEKVDLMKKAILARAFRGELGTNDPSEESALSLLKEVLEEK